MFDLPSLQGSNQSQWSIFRAMFGFFWQFHQPKALLKMECSLELTTWFRSILNRVIIRAKVVTFAAKNPTWLLFTFDCNWSWFCGHLKKLAPDGTQLLHSSFMRRLEHNIYLDDGMLITLGLSVEVEYMERQIGWSPFLNHEGAHLSWGWYCHRWWWPRHLPFGESTPRIVACSIYNIFVFRTGR